MFRLFFVFFVFFAACWLCVCNLFRMLWQSVCNVVAICSPRICNPFRMHSRNVRNVLVICVLHIRHAKVWFLRCKSMVFVVQKGGFYIAKVWFLFFECCVVAICLECYRNLSATFWQSVSNVIGRPFAAVGADLSRPHIFVRHAFAIRQQHFGNPSVAVGVRFIVSAYIYSPPILCVFG